MHWCLSFHLALFSVHYVFYFSLVFLRIVCVKFHLILHFVQISHSIHGQPVYEPFACSFIANVCGFSLNVYDLFSSSSFARRRDKKYQSQQRSWTCFDTVPLTPHKFLIHHKSNRFHLERVKHWSKKGCSIEWSHGFEIIGLEIFIEGNIRWW